MGRAGQNGGRTAERAALLAAQNLLGGAARASASNRRQKIAFVILTLLIAVVGALVARYLISPKTLVFAVGPAATAEHAFADRLATVVQQSRRMHVVLAPQDSQSAALQKFAQGKADLVIVRSDTKIPPRGRAVALLEHSILLIAASKSAKVKSVSALKGKKLAIVGDDVRDSALVRQILNFYEVPPSTPLEERRFEDWSRLFEPNGPAAVFQIARRSSLDGAKLVAKGAKPSFELLEAEGSKALEQRLKGVSSETIDKGLIVPSPPVPDDDIETLAVDDVLLAQSRLSNAIVSELTDLIFQNKDQLDEPGRYATSIQPPSTDKDAEILAHPGAAEYLDDETKTFIDRYSDFIYLGLSLASVVGSIFFGLYSTVTRVAPVRADELTEPLLVIADRAAEAPDVAAVTVMESELNQILQQMLKGLRNGSIAAEGFDAFRLVFDIARDALASRKKALINGAATAGPAGAT